MEVPTQSNRILYDVPCVVCCDNSSGKHYGVFACDGCAGFFKRSVRRDRRYACKARNPGVCIVDKAHRNQCRACRLAKCLEAGMNRDAVQHERGPRNSTIRRQMFMAEAMPSAQICLPPPAPPINLSVQNSAPPQSPVQLFNLHCHRSLTMNATELTFPIKPLIPIDLSMRTFISSSPEVLCEGAARLLFINVRWAKSLPTYESLSLSDRLLLLEESWTDLFVIGSAQFLYPMQLKSLVERSNVDIDPREVEELESAIQEIVALRPDINELACLRALTLFKTNFTQRPHRGNLTNIGGHYKRLQDLPAVAALQEQALQILTEWCSRFDPSRSSQLLQLLPQIRAVSSSTIVKLFFRPTIGTIPIERILTDMYTAGTEIP